MNTLYWMAVKRWPLSVAPNTTLFRVRVWTSRRYAAFDTSFIAIRTAHCSAMNQTGTWAWRVCCWRIVLRHRFSQQNTWLDAEFVAVPMPMSLVEILSSPFPRTAWGRPKSFDMGVKRFAVRVCIEECILLRGIVMSRLASFLAPPDQRNDTLWCSYSYDFALFGHMHLQFSFENLNANMLSNMYLTN